MFSRSLLQRLIPIRLVLSVGEMRVFALSMFEVEEDEEQAVVSNKATQFGFVAEPVEPHLEPLED